jgi:hypothetical protein
MTAGQGKRGSPLFSALDKKVRSNLGHASRIWFGPPRLANISNVKRKHEILEQYITIPAVRRRSLFS